MTTETWCFGCCFTPDSGGDAGDSGRRCADGEYDMEDGKGDGLDARGVAPTTQVVIEVCARSESRLTVDRAAGLRGVSGRIESYSASVVSLSVGGNVFGEGVLRVDRASIAGVVVRLGVEGFCGWVGTKRVFRTQNKCSLSRTSVASDLPDKGRSTDVSGSGPGAPASTRLL